MVLASASTGGQVKWCAGCRLRYINSAPADVCLCCDGALAVLPSRPPKAWRPREPLSREAYLKAVMEPWLAWY